VRGADGDAAVARAILALPLAVVILNPMPQTSLIDAVNTLNPEEQAVVLEFIEFLKRKSMSQDSPFLSAVDQFIADHADLLQRLAQ
jgi:hypothetical protein